jgi:hypothetical protein
MGAMALHNSLRDLVSVRGAGVVEEAEEFRGVLDDFLAEDEATLGELNLLVDAVRLGALRRVLDVMANGAAPQAAIREAGAGLARDRGTDDPTRSCWALASLCFALGKVDEAMVRAFLGDTGTMSAPGRPTSPGGPAPDPVASAPGTAERPMTEVLPAGVPGAPVGSSAPTSVPGSAPGPSSAPPTGTPFGGPVPPVIPEQRSSRAGVYLLVVLVALVLGGLVATGIILLRSDNGGGSGDDDTTATDGRTTKGGDGESPLISVDEMLVSYADGDDDSRIYAVDAIHGGFRTPLTSGPSDKLPSLSPDRRTMTYNEGPEPLVLNRFDLESASTEPFFSDPGPCDHALRPGWSLDGSQVAVTCTGDDKIPEGIWISDADGNLESDSPVVEDALVRGAPTWISETEFIYGRQDDESDEAPLTFWLYRTDSGIKSQLDLGLEGLQLTHADYSEEADKVLFLVSPRGEREVGDVWTMSPDGSNAQQVAEGSYAHPVWSPGGDAIGVTIVDLVDGEIAAEQLAYIPLDDPSNPVVVADPPSGDVGIPVWGTR